MTSPSLERISNGASVASGFAPARTVKTYNGTGQRVAAADRQPDGRLVKLPESGLGAKWRDGRPLAERATRAGSVAASKSNPNDSQKARLIRKKGKERKKKSEKFTFLALFGVGFLLIGGGAEQRENDARLRVDADGGDHHPAAALHHVSALIGQRERENEECCVLNGTRTYPRAAWGP